MATGEAHEQHNQERLRKVTQRLRELKMQWEARVKAEREYQRFRQKPRPHNDSFLVVAAIVSIGALVLDWWVSSTTLESFAVQFGLPPWLLATVVSIIDAGIAVLASGYLAEGELRRERHQKLGLLVMGFLGVSKLIALFFYLQDQYSGRFALSTLPWGIWLQVLLILVVYALLKIFGAGLWYLFALIRRWFPLVLSETKEYIELKHKKYLDILRSTFSDDVEYQRYVKEHDLELNTSVHELQLTWEMKPENREWERTQATKRIQKIDRRIVKAKEQRERYQQFRQELETLPHSEVFFMTAMIVSLILLVADLFISKALLRPIVEVLFQEGDTWIWLAAVLFVVIDALLALYASGYSTRDRHQIEVDEHRAKGRAGLILWGVVKLSVYTVALYIQGAELQKLIGQTVLWGLVIGALHFGLGFSGAGLWYLIQFIRHRIPLLWFGDEQKLIAEHIHLMGTLRSTFESDEEFETYLQQHKLKPIELPMHDRYGDLIRRKQL
jgi:cation transport ATPase